MWKLVKIRADYEGWWLFDDWTEHIVEEQHYDSYQAFIDAYTQIIKRSMNFYDNYILGKYNMMCTPKVGLKNLTLWGAFLWVNIINLKSS